MRVRKGEIDIEDLFVSVVGSRVVLHSARLEREIIPRLSSSYNFKNPHDPPLFRFLSALQTQEEVHVAWSWGPLGDADFLPRVRVGRIVLSTARWRIERASLEPIFTAPTQAQPAAFRALAQQLRMPRWIVLGERDQNMPIDLDNPLLVEALLTACKRQSSVNISELWPSPEELPVCSSEGHFIHELVVPMLSAPEEAESAPPRRARAPVANPRRTRGPGSDWLYLKLYTGPATANGILFNPSAQWRARLCRAGRPTSGTSSATPIRTTTCAFVFTANPNGFERFLLKPSALVRNCSLTAACTSGRSIRMSEKWSVTAASSAYA